MRRTRLIARLDIKAPNLVKGIQMEGVRKIGDPYQFSKKYYEEGVDEILYTDVVASLYDRNGIFELLEKTAAEVFVPITVAGGLRTVEDVALALRSGADKVAINTAAIKHPQFISEISQRFGRQCVVLSIEAKQYNGRWEAFFNNGREASGFDVVEWAMRGAELGAGEVLVTSVDRDGTGKGFDVEVIKSVVDCINVPVLASGGVGNISHFDHLLKHTSVDGIAIGKALHEKTITLKEIREHLIQAGVPVRESKN